MTDFNKKNKPTNLWPSLPYEEWREALNTLHMWMQIVGKVKLALNPFINQWWEVAFYVTPRGITTGRIPYENEIFDVNFDFIAHNLIIRTNKGEEKIIPLRPRSVADFYSEFMDALKNFGIKVDINTIPVEVANQIPFDKDTQHSDYDEDYTARWWHIVVQSASLFDEFRSPFRGKSSPTQFFWGGFDLSHTRFSGQRANPPKIGGVQGRIMKYAENEENFAIGFWPGDERLPHPVFYAYMYPAPQGFEALATGSNLAYFHKTLAEYALPYEEVREKPNPKKEIINFFETLYTESAKRAGWDIEALVGPVPKMY